jgi:hypothetical protein
MVAAFRFDEWETVYKNVIRVLKPGGYIQVLEPDIRVWTDILVLGFIANEINPNLYLFFSVILRTRSSNQRFLNER